jgi:hypothetical protein
MTNINNMVKNGMLITSEFCRFMMISPFFGCY